MNSDNYEFSKSSAPQSVGDYSAYAGKQWNYINDINSGVYQNNGLSLVQWDLSSIYNGGQFHDVSDLMMTVPIVIAATASNGAATVAPPTDAYALCSLKSNYQHLIHQIEIVVNGKVVQDMQPFISAYTNFKLLSSMSTTDLKNNAISMGMSEYLDSERSVKFTTMNGSLTAASVAATPATFGAANYSQPGVGLCNNLPFAISGAPAGVAAAPQNTNQYNPALNHRVARMVDTTTNNGIYVAAGGSTAATSYNGFFGTAGGAAGTVASIYSTQSIVNEFKPYYSQNGNVMIWQDVAIIQLKHLCDVIDKIGLVKKADILVRAYFNTGSIQTNVISPATANTAYGAIAGTSFAQTCPLTINFLPNNQYAANTTFITAGCFIAKSQTSIGGSGTAITIPQISHMMNACRMYYSQVSLSPQKALAYVEANTAKQVVYESYLYNQYSNISSQSNFSQLVQSGLRNPIGVAIIPIINPNNACYVGGPAIGQAQYASCYDTFPATFSPLSLTNLQIQLGGVNILNTSLFYSFENFLEQVSLAETLTSSDIGINTGIITQNWWESVGRVYWVDLARGTEADKATSRNLNIQFTNNNNLAIDVMVFTVYLNRLVINVETGIVRQ